jgi:hypothetical protein
MDNFQLKNVSSEVLKMGKIELQAGDSVRLGDVPKCGMTKGLILHFYSVGKISVVDGQSNVNEKVEVEEEIHTKTKVKVDGKDVDAIEVQKVKRSYDSVLHKLSNYL